MSLLELEMIYGTKAFLQIYKTNILLQNTPSVCSTVIMLKVFSVSMQARGFWFFVYAISKLLRLSLGIPS